MKKKNTNTGITEEQKKNLVTSLNDFGSWLIEKEIVENLAHINHIVELPYSNEDWVMLVDEEKKTVSFNTFVIEKCSFDYFKAIVLHEFFHLAVQKVPNKEDAVRVKDDFGDEMMKLIDIEADYFTALYFMEKLKFGLVAYLQIYYEGSKVFSDRRIRAVKLERFIGTLLSITKMFINDLGQEKSRPTYDLYLPTISPVYTEDSLHVLVIRREHIYFDEIKAEYKDFVEIKKCYTNIDTYTMKGYVQGLVQFSCKALQIQIPTVVKNDINKLK